MSDPNAPRGASAPDPSGQADRDVAGQDALAGVFVTPAMVNAAWNAGKDRRMTGLPSDFRSVVEAALAASSTVAAPHRADDTHAVAPDAKCERASGAQDSLEPPGCPTPGACSYPGVEEELAKRLASARRERDQKGRMLDAAIWRREYWQERAKKAEARAEEAERERDEFRAASYGEAEVNRALKARVAELEAGLRPIVLAITTSSSLANHDDLPDSSPVDFADIEGSDEPPPLTYGDLRRARAILIRGSVGRQAWPVGTRVRKIRGSSWQGRVCGHYSTSLTPDGVCVESEREPGSVQIYPVSALEIVTEEGSDGR